MDRRQADAGHHRLKRWLAGAALLTALPGAALAQDQPDSKGVFSLTVENDSLSSGADRNYTSGIRLGYVSEAERVPDWLQGAGGFTRALSDSDPDLHQRTSGEGRRAATFRARCVISTRC